MADFYDTNKDFRDFIDANAKTYGKTVDFMKLTPIAKEYEKYIKDRNKGRSDKNVKDNSCQ